MAEDKKPKIDLKARLGKMQPGGATPAPPGVTPGLGPNSIPAPPIATAPIKSVVPPPGIPVGPPPFGASPPAIDPNNPLAAVALPQSARAAPTPPPPPQPQRIEVDESAVQEARSAARKQGLIVAALASVIFLGVGYVAGGASEQGAGRAKSKKDAGELAQDLTATKTSLDQLADKMEQGRDLLMKQRKFPDTLAKDLSSVVVDFDGSKLAGRRFSGFPQETAASLVEFITSVQQLNDRKMVITGLLNRLQKPLTEQLNAPAGQQVVNFVVAVDKDPKANPVALVARLSAPLTFTPPAITLPDTFTFANPLGQGNTSLPRYKGGDILTKPAALYVLPKTFEAVCPSETAGSMAQLSAQIGSFIREIRGEGNAQGSDAPALDAKPGLIERADRLVTSLQKVASAS